MPFRTQQDIDRIRRVQRFQALLHGQPYADTSNATFTIQPYLNLASLPDVKLLDLNVASAVVSQIVADTLTQMKIEHENADEIMTWLEDIMIEETLEDWIGDLINGFAVTQFIKDEENYFIERVNPESWYPTLPAFTHQAINKAKVISVFEEEKDNTKNMYALMQEFTDKELKQQLLKLSTQYDKEMVIVPFETIERFKDLQESIPLAFFPLTHTSRVKGTIFSDSLFERVFNNLDEINQLKTQIRLERIKHLKSKLAVQKGSMRKLPANAKPNEINSKQLQSIMDERMYDIKQEVIEIEPGMDMPAYVQRDASIIAQARTLVDKELSDIAFVLGFPRSAFNIDDKGDIHVDTEKKKDRRYVRQVIRYQKKTAANLRKMVQMWLRENGMNEEVTIAFENPFKLTDKEVADLMRTLNSTDSFVSQREAMAQVFPDKTEEQIDEMITDMRQETGLTRPVELAGFDNLNV